jgi:hypothetical protein
MTHIDSNKCFKFISMDALCFSFPFPLLCAACRLCLRDYVHRDLLAGGAAYSAFHKRAPQKSELPLQQRSIAFTTYSWPIAFPSSKRNEEETKREETKKTTDAAPNLLTANRSSGVHLQSVLPLLFFSFPADPFRALQQVLPVVGPIIRLVCGDGSPRSSIP